MMNIAGALAGVGLLAAGGTTLATVSSALTPPTEVSTIVIDKDAYVFHHVEYDFGRAHVTWSADIFELHLRRCFDDGTCRVEVEPVSLTEFERVDVGQRR